VCRTTELCHRMTWIPVKAWPYVGVRHGYYYSCALLRIELQGGRGEHVSNVNNLVAAVR
jgi:hypothetical protein